MKKILIIDEEDILIEPVIDRLKYEYSSAIYIKHCLTGNEGLFQLKSDSFDMVILDMMLPLDTETAKEMKDENIDELLYGIYILKRLREFHKELPVICYTVFNDKVVIEQINLNNAKHVCKIWGDGFDQLFYEIQKCLNKN